MLQKIDSKQNAIQFLENFDIAATISEVELENALDDIALALLYGTRWEDTLLANRKKRRKIPILNDLPLICMADECVFAQKCPVLKQTKVEDRIKLLNTECRDEKIYILEQFADWVRELDIAPDATNDILNVASIVRLVVYIRRIDRHVAILKSMYETKLVLVDNKGVAHYDKQVSDLHGLSEKYNKQINSIQAQLMATRKDRAQYAAQTGQTMDSLKAFLTQRLAEKDAILDAEYIETDDDLDALDEAGL